MEFQMFMLKNPKALKIYTILQHVIIPRKRHGNEVTRLDIALLDSILESKKLNVGYIIIQHMLDAQNIGNRSLLFSTCILQYFWVPIAKPSFVKPKEFGNEAIISLGFDLGG